MRYIIYILMTVLVVGCSPAGSGRVSAADAVKVVQDAESTSPGTSTSAAIAGLLDVMRSRGAAVDVLGWSQDYIAGGIHRVFFRVKTDGELSEFSWEIRTDGTVAPVNKLARNVTRSLTAKPAAN